MKGRTILYSLGTLLLGAIVGMLFAPASGRRSRALVRDKMVKAGHKVSEFSTSKARHVSNVAKGYYHDAAHLVSRVARRTAEKAEEEERAA